MELHRSRVTQQGQISIPARIRQKLGIGPGSVLEWQEEGENIIVRRAGQFTSEQIHQAVFRRGAPATRRLGELKEGIRTRMKRRYAGD